MLFFFLFHSLHLDKRKKNKIKFKHRYTEHAHRKRNGGWKTANQGEMSEREMLMWKKSKHIDRNEQKGGIKIENHMKK